MPFLTSASILAVHGDGDSTSLQLPSSQSSSRIAAEEFDVGAWPESRFHPSRASFSGFGTGVRSAGCCSVGGAMVGKGDRGGATTTGL